MAGGIGSRVVDIDKLAQLVDHQQQGNHHMNEAERLASGTPDELIEAAAHTAIASTHVAEAQRLLAELQAVDPDYGRLRRATVTELKRHLDEIRGE